MQHIQHILAPIEQWGKALNDWFITTTLICLLGRAVLCQLDRTKTKWGLCSFIHFYKLWIWLFWVVYLSEVTDITLVIPSADGKSSSLSLCSPYICAQVLQVIVPSLSLMTCHLLFLSFRDRSECSVVFHCGTALHVKKNPFFLSWPFLFLLSFPQSRNGYATSPRCGQLNTDVWGYIAANVSSLLWI